MDSCSSSSCCYGIMGSWGCIGVGKMQKKRGGEGGGAAGGGRGGGCRRRSSGGRHLRPGVALGLVLVVGGAGLKHGLLGTASAGDLAHGGAGGAGDDLENA